MSFEVGQRVTSRFTGPDTVTGELVKIKTIDDDICVQTVQFDSPFLGEQTWEVKKLNSLY